MFKIYQAFSLNNTFTGLILMYRKKTAEYFSKKVKLDKFNFKTILQIYKKKSFLDPGLQYRLQKKL